LGFNLNLREPEWGLVTGASGLLGSQHAIALLEIGINVLITDLNLALLDELAHELKGKFPKSKIEAQEMDVTSKDSILKVRNFCISNGYQIEVLINNAGIDAKVGINGLVDLDSSFESFTLDRWNKEIEVGVTGAFLVTQVFGKDMADRNFGSIINIASDLSVIAPNQTIYRNSIEGSGKSNSKPVTYSVQKTALIGLTRYLSTYWCDEGVRVNALSPGGVRNNQAPEFLEKVQKLIPIGRLAEADEYKGAIKFLATSASSYMTGQNLVMDGGRSVW